VGPDDACRPGSQARGEAPRRRPLASPP
jgi:hypothetical protein